MLLKRLIKEITLGLRYQPTPSLSKRSSMKEIVKKYFALWSFYPEGIYPEDIYIVWDGYVRPFGIFLGLLFLVPCIVGTVLYCTFVMPFKVASRLLNN